MQFLAEQYAGAVKAAIPAVDMRRSYDRYYDSGLYATRYPVPNPYTLKLVRDQLGPEGGRVLDFGCGSGRYALELAQQPGVSVFAYDISPAAIQQLSVGYNALAQRVRAVQLDMLCGSADDLERRLDGEDGFDLIVLLFGVLGHIEGHQRRVETLRSLRRRLRTGGRLIATVPNRARRFLAEQQGSQSLVAEGLLEPGDILYQRQASDEEIKLYYHLYSPAEFRSELEEAGFAVGRLQPESVLTEQAVLSSRAGTFVDGLLRRITPAGLMYGFVAVARPVE